MADEGVLSVARDRLARDLPRPGRAMTRVIGGLRRCLIAAAPVAGPARGPGQSRRAQAQALINTKNWNRVLAYGQAWTRAEPRNRDAWFLVGRAYGSKYYHIGLERPADAAPAFEHMVALDPQWPDGWHALGVIQQELEQ